jgi:hypothetical protein
MPWAKLRNPITSLVQPEEHTEIQWRQVLPPSKVQGTQDTKPVRVYPYCGSPNWQRLPRLLAQQSNVTGSWRVAYAAGVNF